MAVDPALLANKAANPTMYYANVHNAASWTFGPRGGLLSRTLGTVVHR